MVRVEINEETAYIQARSSIARAVEVNGKACEAEGKAKVVWRKAPRERLQELGRRSPRSWVRSKQDI